MLSKIKPNAVEKDNDARSSQEIPRKELLRNEILKLKTSVNAGVYLGLTLSGGSGGVTTES